MPTRRHAAATLVLCAGLVPSSGCLSVIRQGVSEVRGAQGEVRPIAPIGERELGRYASVVFESAATTVGPAICPPVLLAEYDAAMTKLRRELHELYPGGEPGLRVSSEVLYFQRKGLLSTAQCLTRVRMRESERLVFDGLVVAESNAFSAGGEAALAEASAKALGRFLRSQKGQAGRSERQRD